MSHLAYLAISMVFTVCVYVSILAYLKYFSEVTAPYILIALALHNIETCPRLCVCVSFYIKVPGITLFCSQVMCVFLNIILTISPGVTSPCPRLWVWPLEGHLPALQVQARLRPLKTWGGVWASMWWSSTVLIRWTSEDWAGSIKVRVIKITNSTTSK